MSQVPPPLEQQLRDARRRREREESAAYFAGAFTFFPLVEFWVVPALELSSRVGFLTALLAAVASGFGTQALYKWLADPPETVVPRDHDKLSN